MQRSHQRGPTWLAPWAVLCEAGHSQTPARCLHSSFMGLCLKGVWIKSALTAKRTSQSPSTWTPALSKALLSISPAHAPNTCSCPLSRLLNICKETKSVNQKPQAGSVCLCPRNQYPLLQLVLRSWTSTNHFTLNTASFACGHQAHVGKKPLGNTTL